MMERASVRRVARGLVGGLLLLATTAVSAHAQAAAAGGRSGLLRQAIEERFANRVKEELGLTDEQGAKLRSSATQWAAQRRGLAMQERQLRSALALQLRPGVAADQDSVERLTNDLLDLRVHLAQSYRDEMRDLGRFLNPVQRAQFFIIRERLLQKVQEIRRERMAGGAAAADATNSDAAPATPLRRGRLRR